MQDSDEANLTAPVPSEDLPPAPAKRAIRVASDLHLEFFPSESTARLEQHFLPKDDRDAQAVLILAGDISSDLNQLTEFLPRLGQRFAFVLYVPGNHEYYRSDYDSWNRAADARLEDIPNVQAIVGRVSSRQFDGLRFVCGTLWGDGGDTPAEGAAVSEYLNDFKLIGYDNRAFAVSDMKAIHLAQRADIARGLDGAMPTVVVTHHMPSYTLSHPRFGNACTGGFAGKCDDLMRGTNAPRLWIHGHTHDTFDRRIGATRVVCNPAGYHPEWGTQFNSYFAAPKFVEVEPIAGPSTASPTSK